MRKSAANSRETKTFDCGGLCLRGEKLPLSRQAVENRYSNRNISLLDTEQFDEERVKHVNAAKPPATARKPVKLNSKVYVNSQACSRQLQEVYCIKNVEEIRKAFESICKNSAFKARASVGHSSSVKNLQVDGIYEQHFLQHFNHLKEIADGDGQLEK